jgi:hypothetical protein
VNGGNRDRYRGRRQFGVEKVGNRMGEWKWVPGILKLVHIANHSDTLNQKLVKHIRMFNTADTKPPP